MLPHHASGGGVFYGFTLVSQAQICGIMTKFTTHAIFLELNAKHVHAHLPVIYHNSRSVIGPL